MVEKLAKPCTDASPTTSSSTTTTTTTTTPPAGTTTVHTTEDRAFVQGDSDAAPVVVLEGKVSTVGTDGVASAPVAFSASTPEERATSEATAESQSNTMAIVIALVAIAIVGAVVVSTGGRVRLP